MLILFTKSQLALFDKPVHVSASIRKDGTVVKPHIRIQKVAFKPTAKPVVQASLFDDAVPLAVPVKKRSKLETFLARHGGAAGMRNQISDMTGEQRQHIFAALAKLDGKSVEEVESLLDGAETQQPEAVAPPEGELFSQQEFNPPESVGKAESGSFGVPAGISKAARRSINAQVVDLIASGKEQFSTADKALMRQYSGNGGCGDSLNEFYTDQDVATAMWMALRSLGFEGGSVLEPSCATGVFMHTAPPGVKVTGVELDPISSQVAQVLHGKNHEIVNSSLERFVSTDDENRQFDVVIGNAPFGLRGSLIKDDKPNLKTAEGYFLDTSLDKTKPGGIVAMIVPTGVLDAKSNRALRERLSRKGEFIGAARMPNTAFEHSHTEVTTDIVFFRKRPDDVAGALGTVKQDTLKAVGVWDDEYLSGGYFEGRGARNIYGTMEAGWRSKAGLGQDITVSGSMQGVPSEIAKWTPDARLPEQDAAVPTVPAILAALGDDEAAKQRALGAALKKPYDNAKAGDTKVVDGVTYILQGKPPRWHRIDEFMQDAAVTDGQAIATDIEALMGGRTASMPRPEVEAAVRAYIEKHGVPGKNTNLLLAASQDKSLYRLIGAVNPDGSLSDVVTGRAARRVEGSLDTAAQSLAVERMSGTFSVAELADRIGKEPEEVEDALFASPAYAYAGDGQWTTMDQYLSGELWPKFDQMRDEVSRGDLRDGLAEKYALQAKLLDETIDPKSLEDVEVMVNSAFLPTDVLAAFFNETKNSSDNQWVRDQPDMKITFDGGLYHIEGGDKYSVTNLLEKYLNRTGVRKDDMPTVDRWNEEFKVWLLSSQYRDQVEELYNRKFRGFRQRDFSDATIDIPGMNTEGLKQYQYSGLRWALAAGKGIIAADVGLGKTVRGLMLARMAKMNGQAQKPTFVVPKSVLANWYGEAEKWFPGSRVLIIGETYTRDKAGNLKAKQDTAADRNRKYHELTQNDYDFVFISQPAFNDLDLDPITKGQYVNDDFWVQRGDKLGNAGDKRTNKIREAYEQAIAGREFQKRTDAIYFNDLGIDMMLVDEGHCFPAGTLIDGRPIETYRAGDLVQAFDHISGHVVTGRVANLQIRRPASLYRVSVANGPDIICTGKHPFFTSSGYVFAEDLTPGMIVYKNLYNFKDENERISVALRRPTAGDSRVEMQPLSNRVPSKQGTGLEPPRAGKIAVFLQQILRNVVEAYATSIAKRNSSGQRQPARDISRGVDPTSTDTQSYEKSGDAGESECNATRDDVQACNSWWKRARSNCAAVVASKCARMGNGVSYQVVASGERSLFNLQVGHSKQDSYDFDRSGWQEPQYAETEANRPPQGKGFVELRVDHTEVLERTSDGTFGGMCPHGLVYNIEVERYHNYFAEGILVHNSYKNLFAARNRFGETPKFLGGQGLSNRALDMNLKSRWLREHNGGNGIFMLTATPTKNSPLEIYSMLSHIAPEAFERIGIRNSEEFLDRFCEFTTDKILGTDGTIQDALITVGFKNLGELREIMRRYIDRKTAADVGLTLPKRDDRMHMIDMTADQQAVYADLRQQMHDLATKKDSTGDAHIFSIMDKMAKAAMDLELFDPSAYAGAHSPKYAEAAKNIVVGVQDGGQVVFANSVAVHEKMVAELVKAGIPRDQIAIMNAQAAESSAKRQNISDAFNAGKLKVVIGNVEEGMNLQKSTTDIHHLDMPWEPSSLQQRNGRGLRQGNLNEAVRIHTYLSKGSFDGYRYQSMMAKKDWQDVLWNGGDRVDNMAREGRFDRSDLMIMMAADPEAERIKFEADKAAAQQRYDGEQRRAAASEFVRFQVMKRSYRDLGNKKSISAERLRAKMERAKTLLSNNKYFGAKGVLDSDQPVVIHPDTGIALQRGVGLDVTENDGTKGRWVVTGVNPTHGDVSMRRYGEIGKGAVAITVPSSKLARGVELFKFDEASEAAHVSEKLAAAAASKVSSLEGWDDVKSLPSATLEANHNAIQSQIKEGAKSYTFHMPYGDVPMINRESGEPTIAESYGHTKQHDTHDYMLPTAANKGKVIQAYIADQQARTFGTDYVTKRRGGRSESRFVEKYPGKWDQRHNRWASAGKMVFGDEFDKEAHETFSRVQGERIRRAPTFSDALREAAPMAAFGYSEVPKWPRKALATLFAKAKHDGVLGQSFDSVQQKSTNALPRQLWTYRRGTQIESAANGAYSNGGYNSGSVRDTLIKLADNNGYHDLAAAMMVATKDSANPGATVRELLGLPVMTNKAVADAIRHVIAKHPEVGEKTMKEMGPAYQPHISFQTQEMKIADALRKEAA